MSKPLIEGLLLAITQDDVLEQHGTGFKCVTSVEKWVQVVDDNIVISNAETKKLEEVLCIKAISKINHIWSNNQFGFSLIQYVDKVQRKLVFLTKTKEEQIKWISTLSILRGTERAVTVELPSLQKQQTVIVEDTKLDELRTTLMEILALHNVVDFDTIWGGSYQSQAILSQFKTLFNSISKTIANPNYSIAFNFRDHSFSSPRLRFSVPDPLITVGELLANVCAVALKNKNTFDVTKYCISTLQGMTLRSTETLASFGFGVLFPSWELYVSVAAPEENREVFVVENLEKRDAKQQPGDQNQAGPLPTVTFIFPPKARQDGLVKKTLGISLERQFIPLSEIKSIVANKFGIPDTDELVFVTADACGTPMLLDMDASLHDLGLGWSVQSIVLQFSNLHDVIGQCNAGKCKRAIVSNDIIWGLLEKREMTKEELLSIVRFLDTKYGKLCRAIEELAAENEKRQPVIAAQKELNEKYGKALAAVKSNFPLVEKEFETFTKDAKEALSGNLELRKEKLQCKEEALRIETERHKLALDNFMLDGTSVDAETEALLKQIKEAEAEIQAEQEQHNVRLQQANDALDKQSAEAKRLDRQLQERREAFTNRAGKHLGTEDFFALQDKFIELRTVSKSQALIAQQLDEESNAFAVSAESTAKTIDELKAKLKEAAAGLEKAATELKSIETARYFEDEQHKLEISALRDQADCLVSSTNKLYESELQQHWLSIELQNDISLISTQMEQLAMQASKLEVMLEAEKLAEASLFREAGAVETSAVELSAGLQQVRTQRDLLKSGCLDSTQANLAPEFFSKLKAKSDQIANEGKPVSF